MVALKRAGFLLGLVSLLVEAHNFIVIFLFFAALQVVRPEVQLQQRPLEVGCMLERFSQDPICFPAILAAGKPGTGLEVQLQEDGVQLAAMHQRPLEPRIRAGSRVMAVVCGHLLLVVEE